MAAESSDARNNAGTGHSALCELNYTPEGPDGAVDVALCANFLFAYADVLTVDFHVDAIVELARLARCELLVHPANHRDGSNIDSFIAEVRDRLAEVGLRCSTFAAPGSWLRDAMTIRATK